MSFQRPGTSTQVIKTCLARYGVIPNQDWGLRESMANLNPNLTKLPNEKHIQQFSCKNCILLWHVMGCDF